MLTGSLAGVSHGDTAPQLVSNGAPLTSGATVASPLTVATTGDSLIFVKYYDGTTYLGKITTVPFTFTYLALSLGVHTLKAKVTATNGTETTLTANVTVAATQPTPSPTPTPIPTPTPAVHQVNVSTSAELTSALADAQPGDVITLADNPAYESSIATATTYGTFYASFALTRSGTLESPITITGGRGAVIQGNGISGRYGLYLWQARYVVLKGFTVANASKGIMLDSSSNNLLDNLEIGPVGAEAVHFRSFSSSNILQNSYIHHAGSRQQQFGEGLYIGSANSNWSVNSGGVPDTSDDNRALNNTFAVIAAESVDIKEGTTGTIITGNHFSGAQAGENSADSWIDAKGNNAQILGNTGDHTLLDGYQIHWLWFLGPKQYSRLQYYWL